MADGFFVLHNIKLKMESEGWHTWRTLQPYPIPPEHKMNQASRKGPWLLLPEQMHLQN